MSNLEVWSPGHGVIVAGGTILTGNTAYLAKGSLTWLPAFVTTQAAWSFGAAYAASTDQACGAQVTANSCTYVCTTAGGGNSTVNPGTGTGSTTTAGAFTTVMADGYQWLCIGNATADFTTLASTYQAVSQIILNNLPSVVAGDPFIQLGISLATGSNGGAGDYMTMLMQPLNPDGSTYGDGLGGGSSPSSPMMSQSNIWYSNGKTTPIVGTSKVPMFAEKFRPAMINNSGNALSASTHIVAFRTGAFSLAG